MNKFIYILDTVKQYLPVTLFLRFLVTFLNQFYTNIFTHNILFCVILIQGFCLLILKVLFFYYTLQEWHDNNNQQPSLR